MKVAFITVVCVILSIGSNSFASSSASVSFDSNVRDVLISVKGQSCLTPCKLKIAESAGSIAVTASKDGYKQVDTSLQKKQRDLSFDYPIVSLGGGGEVAAIIFLAMVISTTSTTIIDHYYSWTYEPSSLFVFMKPNEPSEDDPERSIMLLATKSYYEIQKEAYNDKEGEYISTISSMSKVNPSKIISFVRATEDPVVFAKKVMAENVYNECSAIIGSIYNPVKMFTVTKGDMPSEVKELAKLSAVTKINSDELMQMLIHSSDEVEFAAKVCDRKEL